MEFAELLDFVSRQNRRLRERHSGLEDGNAPLAHTVKLNEEVGELCDSVLARDTLQRSEKLDDFEKSDVEGELADVLITSLILAESLDVDIERALETKRDSIERRSG